MKKIMILFVAFAFILNSYSQDYSKLVKHKFEDAEGYDDAEDLVLECVNYLYSNDIKTDEQNRLYAVKFIMRWMEGTNYSFFLGDEMMLTTKGSTDLFGMYLAGMVKTVLDSEVELSQQKIDEKTQYILAKYCSLKSNKLKPSKVLKKIIKKNF